MLVGAVHVITSCPVLLLLNVIAVGAPGLLLHTGESTRAVEATDVKPPSLVAVTVILYDVQVTRVRVACLKLNWAS
jgi:hypothetical protein